MKFRYNTPLILSITVIISITLISIASNKIASHMTDSFEEQQFLMMADVWESKLKGAEKKALGNAEIIAELPNVKAAFAAKNREKLLAIMQEVFRVQHEKYGFSQAQFHEAPATSFLRLHNPKKFGEDMSSYRRIVLDVNQNIAIRKGIEITSSGVGIFGTVPMTDDKGHHTGSFEMALEFSTLLDELKAAYNFELAVFIDEKMLRQTATSLTGEILNEQNRVGEYIRFYTTHTDLLQELVKDNKIDITAEGANYIHTVSGVPYGVLLQPLYNYAHKKIGVIAIVNNFSATHSAIRQAIIWQTLLATISIITLIGLILIVMRGFLLEPLKRITESFNALVSSDYQQTIEENDKFCDELKQLSESYERLRKRLQFRSDKNSSRDNRQG